MKWLPFFLLTLVQFLQIQAQKANSFLIYSVKGNVTVTDGSGNKKAQVGTLLNESSKLAVGPNSLVGIICNENTLFNVVKPGNYAMGQFKDSCITNKSSITGNYLKFIWNQLTAPKGSPEKNRKSFMNNVGAVGRGNISIWIDSRLDTINYYSGEFPVSWKCYSDATEFLFQIFDKPEGGTPLFEKTTKNNQVLFSEFASKLSKNTPYYWQVTIPSEEPEPRRVINFWSKTEFEALLTSIKKANKSGEVEGEAELNFRLGFMLESARFYSDAYPYYLKASQLNPELELYKKTVDAFCKDYNIAK